MDSRKNARKRENNKEPIIREQESFDKPFDSNYEELRKELQISTENTLKRLDELIESSGKRTNKKMYLELFRALVVDSARSSESLIYLFEYVAGLKASVMLLFTEIEKKDGKTAQDMKKIRLRLDELLNSPAMVEIGKVLQNIQKIREERRKTQDKNPSTEYLR
ncbi:MAG TPA: hypothetical protein VLU95_04695 [Candidatus Acidoferrum sp.]|nr:hypothetical protein [Candidatus Acidoferrum sp.]